MIMCRNETDLCYDVCLLPRVPLVVILALVPTFVIAYIHTDQEWTITAHAIVFLKADIAPDSA